MYIDHLQSGRMLLGPQQERQKHLPTLPSSGQWLGFWGCAQNDAG